MIIIMCHISAERTVMTIIRIFRSYELTFKKPTFSRWTLPETTRVRLNPGSEVKRLRGSASSHVGGHNATQVHDNIFAVMSSYVTFFRGLGLISGIIENYCLAISLTITEGGHEGSWARLEAQRGLNCH